MLIQVVEDIFLILFGNDDIQIRRADLLCSQELHLPEVTESILCDPLNIEWGNPDQLIVTLVHENDPELVPSKIVLCPRVQPLPGQKDVIRRTLPQKAVPPLTERAELLQGRDYAD